MAIAREFARRLGQRHGQRSFEIRLFGSRAKGEADEESDLDLFVAFWGDDPLEEVKATAVDIACDLTLAHGTLVSVLVADRQFLDRYRGFSFLEAVEEEGIRL